MADDFTGAADAAGAFAQHGWSVRLILSDTPHAETASPPGTVLARTTGARAASDERAAQLTDDAVRRMIEEGADRLFVKIDSTIRGTVRAQVAGALLAWRHHRPGAQALVCPAFPAQGRIVRGGVVLVGGTPVAGTPSGRDPVAPARTSDLRAIFPGYATDLAAASHAGVVADAETDDDLDRLAELAAADTGLVCVGSAGLASALARRWSRGGAPPPQNGTDGRILVAVSSLHPASREQTRRLQALAGTQVDLLTTPVERDHASDEAARRLADGVRAAVSTGRVGALVIVGGDGAAAILGALGAVGVDIEGVLQVGCPVGTVVGGLADGLRVATKSGGFGNPTALIDLARALSRSPGADTERSKEDHND